MGLIVHLRDPGVPAPVPDSAPGGKRALVLGGGGMTGAAYELGALLALEALLPGQPLTGFDVYVGTSAGAFVAACLANGIDAAELACSQLGSEPGSIPHLTARDILSPASGLGRRAAMWGGAVVSGARRAVRERPASLLDALLDVADGMASWQPYTTGGIEQYLRALFSSGGRVDEFGALAARLLIPATDLDAGRRVVFGEEGAPQVPISTAVAASAAIPLVYQPVAAGGREYVDGGLASAINLDAALRGDLCLAVVVSPLVPYRHDPRFPLRGLDPPPHHVSETGPGRVIAQTFRVIAAAQVERELALVAAHHPRTDVLVIEPRADDEGLFVANLMDYTAREQVARDAFEQVAVDLVTHFPAVEALLRRAGLEPAKGRLVELLRLLSAGGSVTDVLGVAAEGRA